MRSGIDRVDHVPLSIACHPQHSAGVPLKSSNAVWEGPLVNDFSWIIPINALETIDYVLVPSSYTEGVVVGAVGKPSLGNISPSAGVYPTDHSASLRVHPVDAVVPSNVDLPHQVMVSVESHIAWPRSSPDRLEHPASVHAFRRHYVVHLGADIRYPYVRSVEPHAPRPLHRRRRGPRPDHFSNRVSLVIAQRALDGGWVHGFKQPR